MMEEDLLADDWEVEEKQSTITASDFDRAWNWVKRDFPYVHYYGKLPMFETILNEFKDRVKKELGL